MFSIYSGISGNVFLQFHDSDEEADPLTTRLALSTQNRGAAANRVHIFVTAYNMFVHDADALLGLASLNGRDEHDCKIQALVWRSYLKAACAAFEA